MNKWYITVGEGLAPPAVKRINLEKTWGESEHFCGFAPRFCVDSVFPCGMVKTLPYGISSVSAYINSF